VKGGFAAGFTLRLGLSHLLAPSLVAQTQPSFHVTTRPAHLTRGTLDVITIRPSAHGVAALAGWAEGEPLHFNQTAKGTFTALIPAAVEGPDSLVISLVATRAGGERDSVDLHLPVAGGAYRKERLRVEAQYAKPDSAAQQRIRDEIDLARSIAQQAHATPRLWSAPFRAPRPGRITSRFGTARILNGEVQSRHLGTDFGGAVGAPVRAANTGVVALVADFYLAGKVVYLDHGEGIVTGYFHLSRALVATGDTVRRGEIVGEVGRSGRVTGPHLHWIARYGALTVDPESLLRLRKR
jgi:murein DD-endopeptidase MepM/ murein hydrolase activator NlpD